MITITEKEESLANLDDDIVHRGWYGAKVAFCGCEIDGMVSYHPELNICLACEVIYRGMQAEGKVI